MIFSEEYKTEGEMGESDKFVLRWNDFEKNIVGAHKNLRITCIRSRIERVGSTCRTNKAPVEKGGNREHL